MWHVIEVRNSHVTHPRARSSWSIVPILPIKYQLSMLHRTQRQTFDAPLRRLLAVLHRIIPALITVVPHRIPSQRPTIHARLVMSASCAFGNRRDSLTSGRFHSYVLFTFSGGGHDRDESYFRSPPISRLTIMVDFGFRTIRGRCQYS